MDPAHLNKLFSISNWLFLIPCYCQNSIGDLWNTLVPTWSTSDSELEDSYLERKRRSFQKHNSTPPSCGFSHLHLHLSNTISSPKPQNHHKQPPSYPFHQTPSSHKKLPPKPTQMARTSEPRKRTRNQSKASSSNPHPPNQTPDQPPQTQPPPTRDLLLRRLKKGLRLYRS